MSGRRVYLLVRPTRGTTVRPEDTSIDVDVVVYRAALAPMALAGLIVFAAAVSLALFAPLLALPAIPTTSFVTVLAAAGTTLIRSAGRLLVPGRMLEQLRLQLEAAAG